MSDLVLACNCCVARMLPGEVNLVSNGQFCQRGGEV